MTKEKIILAGKIAKEVREWIRPQIKKGDLLLDIAEKIESKIIELGGNPAFPTNLSINEQAAHYTPSLNDSSIAKGLLKIDFGVHIDGWISDNAFSLDLEDSIENKKLIEASEKALENIKKISNDTTIGEIGRIIQETINSYGFNPVANLSGHSLENYNLHSGTTIPNIKSNSPKKFSTGLFAIEPFATNGNGIVHDGQKGNIYLLVNEKNTRSPYAKETLKFIKKNFPKLPFAGRWVIKKMGSKAILGLKQLEMQGILHHYSILTEEKGKLVSQAEHTYLIEENKTTITTN